MEAIVVAFPPSLGVLLDDAGSCLVPVCGKALLSYSLERLDAAGLCTALLAVRGETASRMIVAWIASSWKGKLRVEVVTLSEDKGSADVVRACGGKIKSKDFLVVGANLLHDLPLPVVAAAHRINAALATIVVSPLESVDDAQASGGRKEASKKQRQSCDLVGLGDESRLVYFSPAASWTASRDVSLTRGLVRVCGSVTLRTDLTDVGLYMFSHDVLDVLDEQPDIHCIQQHLLPVLARCQFKSPIEKESLQRISSNGAMENVSELKEPEGRCFVYNSQGSFVARVNSIDSFARVNRDVAGKAFHLTGLQLSKYDNAIDLTATLGSKSTVGPQCVVGLNTILGDKCSVKRSVIGNSCRLGNNVKVMSSVIMDKCTIEDGAHLQGCIVSEGVIVRSKCNLRDCQIGPGAEIADGEDLRGEEVAGQS